MRAKIAGTGSYLPKKIVTNDDLSKTLDTSDEWIATRTGIRQRHVADGMNDETNSYMGIEAAKKALAMASMKPDQLDLIINATVTPDYRLPTNACIIQAALGAKNIPAFDIAAACSGSIYGFSIADSFIRSGTYRNILLVTSEVMSSIVDDTDRNTAVLFGDGASAAVISRSDSASSGFIHFDLYADGSAQKVIWIPRGGSCCPLTKANVADGQDKLQMNGRETFKFAVRAVCDAVEKIVADNNIAMQDIAFIVPHQANLRIIDAIAKRIDIPLDRFLINLDRCANTSAASLMLAYDEANRAGRLKNGDIILMLAIGAGFVWGASLYRV
jgi:3-oxoacyl-[acyl-carrier-protein] synthase-3